MQNIRIYEIPDCKMVSSGVGMFGDGVLERFMEWHGKQPRGIYPNDFLFWDASDPEKQGFNWLCVYSDGMDVPENLQIIDFKGGLYAVTNDIDQRTDMDAMRIAVDEFLSEHGFERDPSRSDLGNIITTPLIKETLGYDQMDYWSPIKPKS